MKINDIITEMTSAGAVATVAMPMGKTIKRGPAFGVTPAKKPKKKKTTERKLSKAEVKTRDQYAEKDLPNAEFKKRYGDEWKSVKWGTATNMAKKK